MIHSKIFNFLVKLLFTTLPTKHVLRQWTLGTFSWTESRCNRWKPTWFWDKKSVKNLVIDVSKPKTCGHYPEKFTHLLFWISKCILQSYESLPIAHFLAHRLVQLLLKIQVRRKNVCNGVNSTHQFYIFFSFQHKNKFSKSNKIQ